MNDHNETYELARQMRMDKNREQMLQRLAEQKESFKATLAKHHPEIERLPDVTPSQAVCPTCEGRGWIVKAVFDDGYIVRTDPMDCPEHCVASKELQARRHQVEVSLSIEKLAKYTGRETPPLEDTLSEYRPRNENQSRAYQAALAYCDGDLGFFIKENPDTFKRSMVFVGDYGSGKTHLVSAIHNQLNNGQQSVWYMKFGEMIRRINDCYDGSIPVTPLQVIHALQYVGVLILDDVGRFNATGATRDVFFDIIDARYEAKNATIITTNLNQQQMINTLGEATGSRLIHIAHWIRLDGNVRDQTGEL